MVSGNSNYNFDSFWSNSIDVASASLNCKKWYQSNLIISCGVGTLHRDMGLDEDVRNLSEGDYDTL
jgi:hypothetical protein